MSLQSAECNFNSLPRRFGASSSVVSRSSSVSQPLPTLPTTALATAILNPAGAKLSSISSGGPPGSNADEFLESREQQDSYSIEDGLQIMENFSMVAPGVYRSAFPKKKNFPFLKKLKLKSILTLILEDYPDQNVKFLEENNIKLFQFGVPGNKEPFVDIPDDKIAAAVSAILDRRNHPLLIHCNKGKHRTGCLVGCIRKMQHWTLTSIFEEYRRFSHPKSRSMDQQFIELFDTSAVQFDSDFLPAWSELSD